MRQSKFQNCRTPRGVRELKLRMGSAERLPQLRRTPRGVRELKPCGRRATGGGAAGRTPRGVRELKQNTVDGHTQKLAVAPHAGCVN